MKRGDVFWLQGANSRRPVVVLSNDAFLANAAWRAVSVVPVATTGIEGRRGPTIVPLPPGAGSLPKPGLALCHQATTVDRARLVHRIGSLGPDYLQAVEAAVKAALDLE